MKMVFASDNVNKQEEIRKIIPPGYNIISLNEAGIKGPLAETGSTLRDNALQKARFIFDKTGLDCFADDTGLEVHVLNGLPGVHSARYAGPACRAEDNVRKLLDALSGQADRRAEFRTVIAALIGGRSYCFEGVVAGSVAHRPAGKRGFGYDPVFIPDGYRHTFAEMEPGLKNRISHRARALEKFVRFLSSYAW